MALSNESVNKIFSGDLQKRLFPNNDFVKESKVDKGIAFNAESIDIPQETLDIETGKDPSKYPLEVQKSNNDKKTYTATLYYTKPFHIPNHEADILSYDKRSSILDSKSKKLRTDFAGDCAYNWSPTKKENIIYTTGKAKSTKLAGATGLRKALTLHDFIEADRILTNMDCPDSDRVALMSGNMYAELLTAGLEGFIGVDKLSKDLITQGVVGMILGFKIYKRSKAALYTNADLPQKKELGSTITATTNEATLFWHPDFVRRGEGNVKVFSEFDKPLYLGSIANAAFRGGATIGRKDEAGVVSLVQGTPSN
ncbi:conserved hypothetical protein [Tenacibaculum sp. 190524A02b]|uniref:Capsid protein n=1 Tax=Tenacibaculum vairaonense TaxID=3137860 RepID=A0ABP1FJ68_9FLAO